MKQCSKCGNANNEFDTSCSFCGYPFDSTSNGDNGTSADNNSFNANEPNNGSSNYSNNTSNDNYYSSNGSNYSQPYYQNNAPMKPKTNSFALASLILGIVSLPLLCCCFAGVITAILAIIFRFPGQEKDSSFQWLRNR